MFSKVDVNGENAIPLFKYLEEAAPYEKPKGLKNGSIMKLLEKLSNTKGTNEIRWNFTKFIVNRKGEVVERFEPTTSRADVETYVKNLVENEDKEAKNEDGSEESNKGDNN